jgi:aminoglycoside phosphotransferase (APT) family kinase protein
MSITNQLVDYQYIDWNKFEQLLRNEIPNLSEESLQVKKYSEGYSNLTYLISIGNWQAVLRRPPFGEIPPKAHDMKREYTILSKMSKVFPLAPKPLLYSEDQQIMNRHFYIMEKKPGVVIDDTLPVSYGSSEEVGPIISEAVIRTLIQLQSISYNEAKLDNIGKPEGYLERQVYGWIKRLERSKTEDITGVKELEDWFKTEMPPSIETTIVHNDFKMNNLLFDKNDPSIVCGVLDWELSTIGDPITDFGSTVAYWGEASDPDLGINVVTNQPGFYSRRQLVQEYALLSGRDVSNINYYVAFGFYKLGVILQQIYYRFAKGELNDARFEHLNVAVKNLFEMATLTKMNRVL